MRAIYRDLQLSVGYNRYNDDILFSIEQITSDPKISLIKFRNVDHRDEMTASLVFAPSIGCWKPEWTASLNSQWFKIGYLNEMKNMSGTTFGIRWNNSFQLPAGYIFRLNGEYTGKGVYQNCYTRPVSCLSTSIYKSFFNGRVDCLLEGNDLFHSMRDANTQYDDRVKMFRLFLCREFHNVVHNHLAVPISLICRKVNIKVREQDWVNNNDFERTKNQ